MRSAYSRPARASPRAQTSALELSIRGDELENHRIQLEQNLQQTDLSLHLSSAAPTDDESVEYARHNSAPSPHAAYRSFERSHLDEDGASHMHGWSYRTVDDDDDHGVRPYGDTISTVGHHASALTLSAGLGGGRGHRREVSLSGAEYDPERPLQDMIAGIGSKYPNAHAISFDPLVADSTVELDRYLRSGRPATPLRSPQTSSSPPSTPGSARASPHAASRPKLSDQLQRGSFSPKRPRNGLASPGVRNSRPNTPTQLRELAHASRTPARAAPLPTIGRPISPTPSIRTRSRTEDEEHGYVDNMPTPRPRAKVRGHASAQSQPINTLQPPAPSSLGGNSTFAKMARGLGKEIATEKTRAEIRAERNKAEKERAEREQVGRERERLEEEHRAKERAAAERRADKERAQRAQAATNARATKGTSARQTERSALKTAGKSAQRNVSFDIRVEPVGLTVSALGGNLHLPDVTGLTSAVGTPLKGHRDYRKYRESDGHREAEARLLVALNAVQTKLADIESENSISRRRVRELEVELEACKQDVARERTRVMEKEDLLLKQRHKVAREEQTDTDRRYRQVVEEKKALEQLISTLRTHLTRVTAELSNQKELLEELRTLREADAKALKDKVAEVELLRDEVERLSGEVEVLREVVEEGLKERRAVREGNSRLSNIDERTEESIVHPADASEIDQDTIRQARRPTVADASDNSFRPHHDRSRSPPVVDRTVRTDRALAGSPRPQFIDDDELERISLELSERRSDRSISMSRVASPPVNRSLDASRAPSPIQRSPDASIISRPDSRTSLVREDIGRRQGSPRPTAPAPVAARLGACAEDDCHAAHAGPSNPEAPFPTIRGTHLERLFFAAPEHNADTCTACSRHRRAATTVPVPQPTPTWLRDLRVQDGAQQKGKQREDAAKNKDGEDQLPPQTVLTRVLRELEDDFTHYKSIYVELAGQYAVMDAASDAARRHVLANHLREVIDCLEQKGDQIASLYDLLNFKDKAAAESAVPVDARTRSRPSKPIPSSSRAHR